MKLKLNRLIFSHIPKTAGTSVRTYLTKNLSTLGETILVEDNHGMSVSTFKTQPLPEDWVLLSGHLDVATLLQQPSLSSLDENIALVTFVRDPIDRLISQLNYARVYKGHPSYELLGSVRLEGYLKSQKANQQVEWLGYGTVKSVGWKIYIGSVEKAKAVCDMVLSDVFEINESPHKFHRLNVTTSKQENTDRELYFREELSAAIESSMSEKHALDLELVEKARSLSYVDELPLI